MPFSSYPYRPANLAPRDASRRKRPPGRAAWLGAVLALVTSTLVTGATAQAAAKSGPQVGTTVRTQQGLVRGMGTADGRQFLGVPYAAQPVGDLRWRAPQPAPNWAGVRAATAFGHRCVQGTSHDPGYDQPTYTEDCLNLNVYTPARSARRLPVMVWFHGGGMTAGAGADVVPDEFAAKGNVIAVTSNYRLGAMGFLATPSLGKEARDGVSGNFGMQDQQAALRWVRDNIASFGGDPGKVTIAGESAGGTSVCTQLVSPGARGLFRSAIIESGVEDDCKARTSSAADSAGSSFAASLGCDAPATAAACLRRKSAKDILNAQSAYRWRPVAGGSFLPEQPPTAMERGHHARVPVLNGANRDEGRLFVYGDLDGSGRPLTADQYPQKLTSVFGTDVGAKALRRYPLDSYPTPTLAYAAAFGDRLVACGELRIGARLAARTPVYAYEFADVTGPPFASLRNLDTDFPFGATHVNEVQYLFKHFGLDSPFNAEEQALSEQMTAYWTSFIRTGVPQAAGQPEMPDQHATPGMALTLRTASAGGNTPTRTLYSDHKCDLWDAVAS
ncbi:carboxylesterase/lipase family protein [Streptomyces sp. NPDC057199]|uniref:carboxylesterase/lipase family protein n=1 Tax=Streptomyces sp. NPDC057199 TaxID=3346047 RepID=UPI003633E089